MRLIIIFLFFVTSTFFGCSENSSMKKREPIILTQTSKNPVLLVNKNLEEILNCIGKKRILKDSSRLIWKGKTAFFEGEEPECLLTLLSENNIKINGYSRLLGAWALDSLNTYILLSLPLEGITDVVPEEIILFELDSNNQIGKKQLLLKTSIPEIPSEQDYVYQAEVQSRLIILSQYELNFDTNEKKLIKVYEYPY